MNQVSSKYKLLEVIYNPETIIDFQKASEMDKYRLGSKRAAFRRCLEEYISSVQTGCISNREFLEDKIPFFRNLSLEAALSIADSLKSKPGCNISRLKEKVFCTQQILSYKKEILSRLDMSVGKWYECKETRILLASIYKEFNINIKVTSKTIEEFYKIQSSRRNKKRGYLILEEVQSPSLL